MAPGATTASSLSGCTVCSAGKWSIEGTSGACSLDCGAGYWCINGIKSLCLGGKYSTVLTASTINTCLSCPEGTLSTLTGSSSLDSCLFCNDGYWSLSGSSTICSEKCGAGYFCSKGSKKSCPAGTYSLDTTAALISTCIACDAGKYSTNTAASLSTTCVNCADGLWSISGSDSCVDDCGSGYYCSKGLKTACSAGKYSSATKASSLISCNTCPTGSFCSAGSSSPTPCSAGR